MITDAIMDGEKHTQYSSSYVETQTKSEDGSVIFGEIERKALYSFSEFFKEVLLKYVNTTEKPFSYKLLNRNELQSIGKLELPPLDLENKSLPKSVGAVMVTEIAKNHSYTDLVKFTSPDIFSKLERYVYHVDYEPIDVYLFKVSFFVDKNQILVVIDVEPGHYLYQFLDEHYFRVIQFAYECVSFAFLEAKLLFYHRRGEDGVEGATFLFGVPIKPHLLSYFNYVLTRYGSCDGKVFFKSMKRKALALSRKSEKVEKIVKKVKKQ